MRLVPRSICWAAAACACCAATSTPRPATPPTRAPCSRGTGAPAPTGCTSSTWTAPGTARREPRRHCRTGAGARAQPAGRRRLARHAAVAQLFEAGVDRAVIGSAALTRRTSCRTGCGLRPERVALAFDVRVDSDGIPRVAIHGWRDQSAVPLWRRWRVSKPRPAARAVHRCEPDGALTGQRRTLCRARALSPHRMAGVRRIRDARDLQALASAGPRQPSAAGAVGRTHSTRGAARILAKRIIPA